MLIFRPRMFNLRREFGDVLLGLVCVDEMFDQIENGREPFAPEKVGLKDKMVAAAETIAAMPMTPTGDA
jgi:hypothetical protein